jgi:membrane protein YdbS with pleckstrin-like domain
MRLESIATGWCDVEPVNWPGVVFAAVLVIVILFVVYVIDRLAQWRKRL